jgi:ATP-dependent helicase/nuclease subunit B
MPSTLYLTPNSETTRRHVVDKIEKIRFADPLAEVRLLLPTGEAMRDLRRFLGDGLGLQFYQFYGLGRWILDQAGRYPQEASDVLATRLVSQLMREMLWRGELSSFTSVMDKPGFTQVVIEWIREVKSQGVHPDEVHTQAQRGRGERDRQLALIYQRYQDFLAEKNYADPDGLLWLAAEALEEDPQLARLEQPFLTLDYDHFNPLQLRILRQMASRCLDFSIYLLWDERRRTDSLALSRISQTRVVLEEALHPVVTLLDDIAPPGAILHHVRDQIFEHNAEPIPDIDPPELSAVSAPTRELEVRRAMREIKQLLLNGVSVHEIALLAPAPEVYRALVSTVSEEYSVPVQLSQTLSESPISATLTNLLVLWPEFPRRQTLDTLRSPYIRQKWLSLEEIELLDQLSRERPVVKGREQWRFALRAVEAGEPGFDEDERAGPRLARRLGAEQLAHIQVGLEAFFEHLTPPVASSYSHLALWVQEALLGIVPEMDQPEEEGLETSLIPSLDLAGCCRENQTFAWRDMQVLSKVLGVLRELMEAERLAPLPVPVDVAMNEDKSILRSTPWEAFRSEFLERLVHASLPPDLSLAGVRFGPLSAARDGPRQHLFVLGLSEGEFPHPPRPDVFYSPQERAQQALPLLQVDPAADASLWWQVLGSAQHSLTLLRPRLDENGAPWLPSPFWQATLQLVKGVREEEIPIAVPPQIDQAACHSELLVALAAAGAQAVPGTLRYSWEAAQRTYAVTRLRQGWGQPGHYEGFLAAADIRAELAERFGPRHVWSASRLNGYGNCPFGFFAQFVLELEALPDPQEGFDAMQRGSLLHEALEQLHTDLVRNGLSLRLPDQEVILEHLVEVCRRVFRVAPQRYGFRPSSLWAYERRELERQLEALLRWECSENGQEPRFWPYRQEETFGLHGSALPALVLEDVDGSHFRVHGVIDRIDRDEAGNLRVIDYKSGSTIYSKMDIEQGLAFQTALYAMAVEPHLLPGARVLESFYLLIPSRTTSGSIQFEGQVADNETVQAAVGMALAFIRFIRRGEFPSLPGKATRGILGCRQYCDFIGLCRVNRLGISKARRRSA